VYSTETKHVVIVAHYFPNRELRLEKKSLPVQKIRKECHGTKILPVGTSCRRLPGHLGLAEKTQPFPILEFPKTSKDVIRVGFGRLPSSRHIGLQGHRKVLRSAAALEGWVGEQPGDDWNVGLWTATLPGSTKESMEALSCWSAFLLHDWRTKVAKWLKVRNLPCLWVSVWEWQRRGALHLHVAIALPGGLFERLESYLKKIWIRGLERVTDNAGVDLFGREWGGSWAGTSLPHCCNLLRLDGSVAAYLAKYLSKSESKRHGVKAFFCPSRWWGSSMLVKCELRNRTLCAVVNSDDRCDSDLLDSIVAEVLPVSIKDYSYVPRYRRGLTHVIYVEPAVGIWVMSWLGIVSRSSVSLGANLGQVFLREPDGFVYDYDRQAVVLK
jgi:hypothetical protein